MINLTRLLIIFISSFLFYSAASQSITKTLPGYSGHLPFKLETGYVTVGRNDDIELFYYFVESERNPKEDPLILWVEGGPGESGLTGLSQMGPFAFDLASFNGSLPSLLPRQHSWTKVASVIFIDQPVGVGFSYGTQGDHYNTSDIIAAKDTYTFLRKWLLNHPMFIKNDLYIGGISYAGKIVPILVLETVNGNGAGLEPHMSLQGYFVGNPITSFENVINERIPYAHGVALISTEYYESAKSSCSGQYVNADPDNLQCLNALKLINNCLRDISTAHILETPCSSTENKRGVMLLEDNWLDILLSSKQKKKICREDMKTIVAYVWGNSQEVQDALNIRKGTIRVWKKKNKLAYTQDVASAVPYHQALIKKIRKAMVYSGDHDITAPYTAPLKWMSRFNLTLDEHWRPWHVNGEVAGYTQNYKKDEYSLTYVTVKGGGHAAAEYNPEQCLAMLDRWMSSNRL